MTSSRRTQLLALLLITSLIACGMAWSFLDSSRARAAASLVDRTVSASELQALDLTTAGHDAGTTGDLAINRRLRAAAMVAHASDQLASIEPGTAVRVKDTGFSQTPIYVRLNAVSLKQLTTFLCEISAGDDKLLTTDIELSPPLVAPVGRNDSDETWTADITFRYLASN